MRTLPKPNYLPETVYETCINRVRNPQLKHNLESIVTTIGKDASDYDVKSEAKAWYLLNKGSDVDGVVSLVEMEKIYTARMAKKNSPGREIYDQLKAAAPHGTCPLCGQREVKTLDHYLPKSAYPSFVVLPYNLVPACSDCNKTKLSDSPDLAEEQTLHPYYDEVSSRQWLFATVRKTTPASFRFFVQDCNEYDGLLNTRLRYHFETLELSSLYSTMASVLLSDIRFRLNEIYIKGGKESVIEYLREEEVSRRSNHLNSWQTAVYQAMMNDDWFCDGGFIGF